MTIFRFSLILLCLFLPAPLLSAVAAAPNVDRIGKCGNIDPLRQRKCVGARIDRKELLMKRQFIKARVAVARVFARYGSNDNRTNPKFLDESQGAWKRFAENNCTVIAAYPGGSNSAISDRIMDCYEDELDRRIKFLRHVSEGTGPVDLVG